MPFYSEVSHFGGQVQIWMMTKACYKAGSVDHESGVNDGTVLFGDMSAI